MLVERHVQVRVEDHRIDKDADADKRADVVENVALVEVGQQQE